MLAIQQLAQMFPHQTTTSYGTMMASGGLPMRCSAAHGLTNTQQCQAAKTPSPLSAALDDLATRCALLPVCMHASWLLQYLFTTISSRRTLWDHT